MKVMTMMMTMTMKTQMRKFRQVSTRSGAECG
jgi:hypothetical protein